MTARTILLVNKFLHADGVAGGVGQYILQERSWLENAGWTTVPFGLRNSQPVTDDDERWLVRGRDYSRVRIGRSTVGDAASLIWNLEAARKIDAVIRRHRPAVAHLHNIYHHLSPSILPVLRRHGVPIVMTIHDLRLICPAIHMPNAGPDCPRCLDGNYLAAVRKRCVHDSRPAALLAAIETLHQRRRRLYRRHVDLFLCPSDAVASLFIAHGYPAERMHRLPNAVDLAEWRPDAVGLAPAALVTGLPRDTYAYVGRLSREKDLVTLLRAHAAWEFPHPLRLLIIGDGPQREELQQEARRLRLADVTFTGHLGPDAIREALREVLFTVLPSTCHENRPLAVLESLACGLPVVASRVGGLPEIVREGQTGFLFQPGDSADLLAALRRAERDAFAQRGAARAWAEEHADLHRHMTQLEGILTGIRCAPRD